MGTYLADSAVSPLAKKFIGQSFPNCSLASSPKFTLFVFYYLQKSILHHAQVRLAHNMAFPLLIVYHIAFSIDITFHPTDAEKSITTVYISSVPYEQLSTIEESFKKALAEEAATMDMDRLKMVIERAALKTCNAMEVDAPDCLSSAIISNFLYGSDSDLVSALSAELERYKILSAWSVDQWSEVFKKSAKPPPPLFSHL